MPNSNIVSLTISSSILSVQDIINYFKINPSKSYEKGTPINPRIPNKNIRTESHCMMLSKLDSDVPIEDKFNELFDIIIQNNLDTLTKIKNNIKIHIYCSYYLEESDTFSLSSATLAKISSLPIDILIDIYHRDPSEED